MDAIVEYRVTENLIVQKKKKIKDGKIKIGNKEYIVHNTPLTLIEKPFLLFFKKAYPYYRITHNAAMPLVIDERTGKLKHTSPESLKAISEDASMRTLLSLKSVDKMNFMLMLMAGAIGAMAGYIIAGMG